MDRREAIGAMVGLAASPLVGLPHPPSRGPTMRWWVSVVVDKEHCRVPASIVSDLVGCGFFDIPAGSVITDVFLGCRSE
jgi:hypothetical protein